MNNNKILKFGRNNTNIKLLSKFLTKYNKIDELVRNKNKNLNRNEMNIKIGEKQHKLIELYNRSLLHFYNKKCLSEYTNYDRTTLTLSHKIDLQMILDIIKTSEPYKTFIKFSNKNLAESEGFTLNAVNEGGVTKQFFNKIEYILTTSLESIDFIPLLKILAFSKINNAPITADRYIHPIYELIVSNRGEAFKLLQEDYEMSIYHKTNILAHIKEIIQDINANVNKNKKIKINLIYRYLQFLRELSNREKKYINGQLIELYSKLNDLNDANFNKKIKNMINIEKMKNENLNNTNIEELQYRSRLSNKNVDKLVRRFKVPVQKVKIMNSNFVSKKILNININSKDDSSKEYVKKLNEITELSTKKKLRGTEDKITDDEQAQFNQILADYYNNDFLYFWYCHYTPLKISKNTLHIFKDRLQFSSIPNFPQFELYVKVFKDILQEITEEELIRFHMNLTATDNIQQYYKCNFDIRDIVSYHTCFNSVDIPIDISLTTNIQINDQLRPIFICLNT